ncbi:hypothetical protein CFP56_013877 [Quercus suber]|uniref:Uncharacterized protein n=1 Tax=Quercus suber TaxID=58331 RepID=A0AAW0M2R1_QUESU
MLVMTSWPGNDNPIISCTEVHNKLVYGFELSWNRFICESQCGRGCSCYFDNLNLVQCNSGKIGGMDFKSIIPLHRSTQNLDWSRFCGHELIRLLWVCGFLDGLGLLRGSTLFGLGPVLATVNTLEIIP